MLPDQVKKQVVAIRRALSSHGWEVAEVEQPFENEWWVAEVWRIESEWSPQGVCAYLAFLVDPQGGRDDVWAVRASREHPTERADSSGPMMRLKRDWQQELPAFVSELSHFCLEQPREVE